MQINLGQKALKFLDKQDEKTKSKIKEKVMLLKSSIEENGIIPINMLDIKTLKCEWRPMKRMRIGNIRIIFTIDFEEDKILIPIIDNRGDIY